MSTSNDINSEQRIQIGNRCDHVYLAQAPMGYYLDLGERSIGNRPVWKSYEVGNPTWNTPKNYVPNVKYECKQPCWSKQCR